MILQASLGWVTFGIAVAAAAALFLDDPKGTMTEVMPDGSEQMSVVHWGYGQQSR